MQAAQKVFEVRAAAAEFFGAETENVAFTVNCTYALNMAIKGIMQYGGHMIISDHEHNAVSRPVYALSESRGVEFSIARITDNEEETLRSFRRLIRPDTKCICCCVASNVTGRVLPYKRIAKLCKEQGICFIADCSQAAGIIDLKLNDGFDFICTSGHKALYGPTGTGLLITNGEYPLSTIIEGGTGTNSALLEQPSELPERLESGTLNTVGIIGLGEGIRYVSRLGPERIRHHEQQLCSRFISRISERKDIRIYRSEAEYLPIVSFNIGDTSSHIAAMKLSEKGFALRGGLQCAALAHDALGTTSQGTVRFSPSVFNTLRQTDMLADAVLSI